MPYGEVQPVVDMFVHGLCRCAYPNHPHGCPNYDKKKGCPPGVHPLAVEIDLDKPVYVIWNCFGFAGHVAKMRRIHPTWSKRQLECCLYWQGTARKRLKQEITQFLVDHPRFYIISCPEAQDVNVTATMKQVDVELEWPPVSKTYQVVLAGERQGTFCHSG